jgi:dihydroorotate dehydrogenase (NAD+) catalytic subunit
VQVGTATFVQPDAALQVIRGIEEYLSRNDIGSIAELVGSICVD